MKSRSIDNLMKTIFFSSKATVYTNDKQSKLTNYSD